MSKDNATVDFALEEVEKVRVALQQILERAEDDAIYNRASEAIDEIPWIEDALHRLAGRDNPAGDPSEPGHPANPESL